MRKILICLSMLIFSLYMSFNCVMGSASPNYDEEIFMPVGAYFRMDTKSDVHYAVIDGDADVVLSERGKEVYLYKLGKVIVQTSYYLNGDHNLPYQCRYLINVVPQDVFNAGQKDNFRQLRLNPQATYQEVDENFAEQVLLLVNKERAKIGARALRLDSDLQNGAAIRAEEISRFFSHTRPNGEECKTVLRNQVYIGENIACGQNSAEDVVKSWMESPGHRRNILDPNFRALGVGFCLKEHDSQGFRYYWVQMFRG